MPVLVQCSTPGCVELVPIGQSACANHQRGTSTARGYDAGWSRAAARFKREHPFCGDRRHGQRPVLSQCFEEGRPTLAYAVDHVVPHRGDLGLFWDQNNWQSLCASCHAAKTRAGL